MTKGTTYPEASQPGRRKGGGGSHLCAGFTVGNLFPGNRHRARFAMVGAAGELATEAGLTGWPMGESERAARACFNAWLAARSGIGNGEVSAMLKQVRRFLESHGEGRFTWWHRAASPPGWVLP